MSTSYTRKHIEHLRQQAVALFDTDLSNAEIGRRIGVSRPTVSQWRKRYRQDGAQALKLVAPGPEPRLTQEQLHQLAAALLQGPQAHGYPTQLWTLERIADLIHKQAGVSYHPGHVWYLLQRMGWSCQKPQTKAKERNQAAIADWIAVDWPRIKKGHRARGHFSLSGREWLFPQTQCPPYLGTSGTDPDPVAPVQLAAGSCPRSDRLLSRWQLL
jgi:transposase